MDPVFLTLVWFLELKTSAAVEEVEYQEWDTRFGCGGGTGVRVDWEEVVGYPCFVVKREKHLRRSGVWIALLLGEEGGPGEVEVAVVVAVGGGPGEVAVDHGGDNLVEVVSAVVEEGVFASDEVAVEDYEGR